MKLQYYIALLFFCVVGLVGCQQSSGDTASEGSTSEKAATTKVATLTTEEAVTKFKETVQKCTQLEYFFYVPEGSITTQTEDPAQIANFARFITSEVVPNTSECTHNGSLVFRENDDIVAEADYVFMPECQHIRIKVDGQYFSVQWEPIGLEYMMSFLRMIKGAGAGA